MWRLSSFLLICCGFAFAAAEVSLNPLLDWTNRSKRETRKTILDETSCSELKGLCHDLVENHDILILECLLSLDPDTLTKLNNECQHVIWKHTNLVMDNKYIKSTISRVCQKEQDLLNCPVDNVPGSYLKCVVNNKEEIANKECTDMILRLENVAFNDYQWIAGFLKHCNNDIDALSCGRLGDKEQSEKKLWTQFETIACLQNKFANVSESCRSEVFRLSELQADSIKLDRQLYMACAEDQMRYCRHFAPGSGKVFNCLMKHRDDNNSLTNQCRNHLLRRQKLISQDYRVSKGLMRACKEDIKKSHCRRQTSDDKSIRLAQVLMCLEGVIKNGSSVDANCEAEMRDHRKILMEDYRLSPEIVNGCSKEIKKYCIELEVGGKTIHCLMGIAQSKAFHKKLGDVCQRALESLIKETDAGEDWRVDPVLHEACNPVVQVACKNIRGGDARVMSCLLDNIGEDHMTDDCEDALMQIQYFIARDFKLDPQLYRACRDDAYQFCHASKSWEDRNSYNTDNGPLVLPCLYRYAYHPDKNMQLKDACFHQIRRVMRQRAVSVHLNPEIEEICLEDLATYCFEKTKMGEEMMCLQDNLDKLESKCKESIIKYTEMEAEHMELNPYVMSNCQEIIKRLCSSEMKHDEGDVMECLVTHKNDPFVKSTPKCRISIEHFQLISIKDYRFTYKFKVACKPYAVRFCNSAKTKGAVVACLSEKITNDTIAGVKSDIQKECRQQLKAQLFQQRESIDFDPQLAKACEVDIKMHCKDVEHVSAQVLECLQMVPKLTGSCHSEIFKVKKQEITDNSVDYALNVMCSDTMEQFCPNVERSQVLECLKKNKDEKGFSKKCRQVVTHRMIEQNSDYRLNPSLQENCKVDILKFCKEIVTHAKPDRELNGEVIKCLKNSFKHSRLSNKCEKEMAGILREQAMDLQLNPLLRVVCKNELDTICQMDESEDYGRVEECLKTALLKKQIPTRECQEEVASMIEISQADIQVDPLLQQACALDLLKFCKGIPQGSGRHIKCLKIMMEREQLSSECKDMLTGRLEMLKNALQVMPPANFQQLYTQVVASPAKHYFFIYLLTMLGIIFVVGIYCGRRTRKHVLIKNK